MTHLVESETTPAPPSPAADGTLTIPLSRRRIRLVLALGVAVLVAMHLLVIYSTFVLHRSVLYGTVDRFHLDGEGNVPTWYATLLLLAGAVAFGLIAAGKRQARDPYARHWGGIALILLYMCADEGAQFHELLTRPMQELIDGANGWLRFTWVVPGAVVALAIGLAYLRFLMHLPPATARRLVAAGAIYLGAAIGLEVVGAWYITNRGNDAAYNVLAGAEEALENVAAILALDVALAHLAAHTPTVRLALSRADAEPPPA